MNAIMIAQTLSILLLYIITSIEALRQASLPRRIVDVASTRAVKVCARFSVGVVLDRELFCFFWEFGDQGRDWNVLAHHLALEISISEHASSPYLAASTAGNSLACFQVLNNILIKCIVELLHLCCEGASNWK